MDENDKINQEEAAETEEKASVYSYWAAKFFKSIARKEENPAAVEAEAISFLDGAEGESEVAGEVDKDGGEDGDEAKGPRIGINFTVLFLIFALVIIVTVFVTFFVAKKVFTKEGVSKGSSVSFADESLDPEKAAKFQNIIKFIQENYYKDYDMDDLIEGAIEGFVGALDDPYGKYYSPGEMDSYTNFVEGTYTGVGITVAIGAEGATITEVVPKSPAEKAGLALGDIITHVNDKAVKDLSSEELSAEMGITDKAIVLEGKKADGAAFEISVNVEKIVKTTVEYKELENNIKYIYVSQFISGTADEFKAALEKAAETACRGIIIDLRGNPGGYEREASAVADMILPEGTIATSRDRDDNILRTVTSDANEISVPVVLLVNANSASAAELVAGAFRDFEKGEIVGVHTYGKALAQINKVFESDGSGIVLTSSRYFTPSGECIDGVGIEPTVTVELPEELSNKKPSEIPLEEDLQLAKAIEIIEGEAE